MYEGFLNLRWCLILCASVALASGSTRAAPKSSAPIKTSANTPSVDDELRRARNEYAYGSYEDAAKRLRELLYPMRLSTDTQVIEARKYLALSYYLLGKTAEIEEEFAKLLYLDPDYELDPFSIAPPVIELFENVRQKLRPELDAIRQRKSDTQMEEPGRPGHRRIVKFHTVEHSELATLLPFGVGQFQNGALGWGIFFAAAETVLLAVNIGSYLYASRVVGDRYPSSERRLVQALTVAQYASIALFTVTWSVGVLHARVNFSPIEEKPPVVTEEVISSWMPKLNLFWHF